MRSRGDTYAEETYLEEDVRDQSDGRPYEDEEDETGRFPYLPSWGWGGAWGLAPWTYPRREADERRYDEPGGREGEVAYDERGGIARYWDEGLITLLIVGGAVLFLFPEPATSGLGVLLMAVGVVAWLVDWAT